jgi:hypothetical protein|tara:strand:+ start:358 stop:1257 length:900 start_codon:yes stop_codon:yes gene_type:complete
MAENDYSELLVPTSLIDGEGSLRTDFGYTPLEGNSPWSINTFKTSYDGHKTLENATNSEYSQLMLGDDSLDRFPSIEVERSKNSIQNYSLEGLLEFGRNNGETIADIVWDADKNVLANYTLQIPYFKGDSEKFNNTLEKVKESKKEIDLIEEDHEKYILNKFEKLSDTAKAFYAPFAERLVQEYHGWARNIATAAIGEYGFPKFASTNINNAYKKGEKQKGEAEEVLISTNEKIRELGENLREGDINRLNEDKDRKMKEISERYDHALELHRGLTIKLMELGRGYIPKEETGNQTEETN